MEEEKLQEPQVKDAPKEFNALLEEIYRNCMRRYEDEKMCSMTAWDAVKKTWFKDKDGKWKKRKK